MDARVPCGDVHVCVCVLQLTTTPQPVVRVQQLHSSTNQLKIRSLPAIESLCHEY